MQIGIENSTIIAEQTVITIAPSFIIVESTDLLSVTEQQTILSATITLSTSAALEFYNEYSLEDMSGSSTLQDIVEYI